MGMRRVEVVVRFAGDLLDVIHLPAGTTAWIGTTAVRAIAGTEVSFGHIAVTVSALTNAPDLVPRRPLERRPFVYGALSLVAQLAVVVVAFWSSPDEPVTAPAVEANSGTERGATRIKRFAMPAQTIERTAQPAPTETPITADQSPEEESERDAPAPQEMTDFVPSEMTGGGLVTDATKDGDGTSRFDPAENPAFDTIKTGDYSTLSSGRTAGDGYAPEARNPSVVVISCDRASCLVLGGEKAVRVRKAVDERLAEITDCYKRAAMNGGGDVEIDFEVDATGTVDDLAINDADPAGTCVAKILRTLKIDAIDTSSPDET